MQAEAGKGSKPRKQQDQEAFSDGWDRIFGKKTAFDPLKFLDELHMSYEMTTKRSIDDSSSYDNTAGFVLGNLPYSLSIDESSTKIPIGYGIPTAMLDKHIAMLIRYNLSDIPIIEVGVFEILSKDETHFDVKFVSKLISTGKPFSEFRVQ